jgi:hypothetical protein
MHKINANFDLKNWQKQKKKNKNHTPPQKKKNLAVIYEYTRNDMMFHIL